MIEPKKENETAKDFKNRLRQETRKTLNEELHKMTCRIHLIINTILLIIY